MIKVLANAIHHTIEYGDFDIYIIQGDDEGEHVVLIHGNVKNRENVLCRVSSECLPGTALFSAECDCKQQIEYALKSISEEENGIFIYLRQEGRGYGLTIKIKALANKNKGDDTFTAVERLGLPADAREYSVVKQILEYFKIESIRCMSNNPDKVKDFIKEGITVKEVVHIPVLPNKFSSRHLYAKRERGHEIPFKTENNPLGD